MSNVVISQTPSVVCKALHQDSDETVDVKVCNAGIYMYNAVKLHFKEQ